MYVYILQRILVVMGQYEWEVLLLSLTVALELISVKLFESAAKLFQNKNKAAILVIIKTIVFKMLLFLIFLS